MCHAGPRLSSWPRVQRGSRGRRAEPASRPGSGKGEPPSQPSCPPPWVTGPPREFKAANESGELASERGVNAGGGHASARLSFARRSSPELRAAAPRTCFVRFVQTERAGSTPSRSTPQLESVCSSSSPPHTHTRLVDVSTSLRLLPCPLESYPTLLKTITATDLENLNVVV